MIGSQQTLIGGIAYGGYARKVWTSGMAFKLDPYWNGTGDMAFKLDPYSNRSRDMAFKIDLVTTEPMVLSCACR